jgi:hypothetical protein
LSFLNRIQINPHLSKVKGKMYSRLFFRFNVFVHCKEEEMKIWIYIREKEKKIIILQTIEGRIIYFDDKMKLIDLE